jgi:hypothetical protein
MYVCMYVCMYMIYYTNLLKYDFTKCLVKSNNIIYLDNKRPNNNNKWASLNIKRS